MNILAIEDRKLILHALCEGMSMRSCSRVFDRPMGTIARLVANVGDWAIDHLANIPPVTCRRIQVDELWSFVGENDRRSALKQDNGGVRFIYLAVDRDSGLVICSHIGLRGKVDATKFFRKLDRALAKDEHGNFVVKPTIVSDGLRAYADSFERVFGNRADFGQYVKIYDSTDENGEPTPRSKFKKALRIKIAGDPDLEDLSTWRVERENGYARQSNRRLTRKTNGFSKVMKNHERQLAIGIIYRNYCWEPRPKRPPLGSSGWIKRVTASMETGLADHMWTPRDMLLATDAFIAARAKPAAANDDEADSDPNGQAYWVVHHPYHAQGAMIHRADCSSCRGGLGRLNGASKRTFWFSFATLDEALAFAAAKEPDAHNVCKKCLGEYYTLTRYGPRR